MIIKEKFVCADCGAVFKLDIIDYGSEGLPFCIMCGSEDVLNVPDEEEDKEGQRLKIKSVSHQLFGMPKWRK